MNLEPRNVLFETHEVHLLCRQFVVEKFSELNSVEKFLKAILVSLLSYIWRNIVLMSS